VSSSDAFTGCHWREARRPVPRSRYGGMRFGPFYVAETDSSRPAHFARLLNFLRRKGNSREDAEDLIQEAMLHLHVYAKGAAVMNEEAFLRRAVHNLAIDQYRRDRSRQAILRNAVFSAKLKQGHDRSSDGIQNCELDCAITEVP